MAGNDSNTTTPKPGEWKKRESFGSALMQIGGVAVVLALVVFVVYKRGSTRKELGELMKEARATAQKGNYGDQKKALKIVEDALAKDSSAGDPNAFAAAVETDLFLLHHEAGADAKAKEYLEKAKKADAQTEERFGVDAQLMLAAGNAKGAEDFVEELRKKGGSGARIYLAQAQALKAQGNLALARTGFSAASDKAWRDGNYGCAAGEATLEEAAPGALDLFTRITGQSPELVRARLGLALARVQKKDRLGDAESIVKDVLAKGDELSKVQKARAMAVTAGLAVVGEQFDAAISTADQALALNPDDVWALFYKAEALAAKKDPAAAAAFDATVAKAPSAPVFYFEGAQRLQRAGQLDAATALLNKYEAFFKNVKNVTADGKQVAYLDRDDRYWLARGDAAREASKLDDALAAYDKAIEAKNINLNKAYLAKGTVLISKKDYDKAGQLLQDITPPDGSGQLAEAYMAMGEVLFAKKEYLPGCQNYAFALARMKTTQQPREKLNELLGDVEKKLKAVNQAAIAKEWIAQAKPLIQ
jgi:tetratricopeptide (TPR) repeat protein